MRLNYIENCDCLDGIKNIPDNSVDLTVTSPPYDDLRSYNGYNWDALGIIEQLYRVTKPGGVVVWIVNDATVKGSETGSSFKQALAFMEHGFNLHDTMIWKKTTCSFPDRTRYYSNFEYMFVFSRGKPKKIHLLADRPNKWAGTYAHGTNRTKDGSLKTISAISSGSGRKVKNLGVRFNVWDSIPEEKNNKTGHPAVFPVALAQDHILSWSDVGDTVLDPFMGSGTTAVAAIKTGRNYIGFEISDQYCKIAQRRIAESAEKWNQMVYDERHGEWVDGMKCSKCGQVDTTKPNYCPDCGAKMDKEG